MKNTSKKLTMTAPILRIILSVTMIIIVVAGAGLWKFGTRYLDGVAKNVAAVNQESSASNDVVSQLQSLQTQLNDTKEAQEKAKNIVAESQGYHFQNQITEDIQRFASSAGLNIQNFTFSGGVKGESATIDGASSASSGTPTVAAPTIAGLTPVTVTISLKSPINYKAYLTFLHDIEQNSLKMQISGLSLSSSNDRLTSQDLTIQAYINQ